MTNPSVYLSTSHGFWRLIYRGGPVAADTRDVERVLKLARDVRVGGKLIDPATLPCWDGDIGDFVEFTPELVKQKASGGVS
jgi:hypothetical protein